jgi:hypothetical protein
MTQPNVYRGQKVWLKDDDGAGNPPFVITEIEIVTSMLANLELRQIDTGTGERIGMPVTCTSDKILTSPPDTLMTRVGGRSEVHIEVVHMRDPDGYDDPTFYVNGQPVGEWSNVRVSFYNIDCGAGREFVDLVDAARGDRDNASPRVWSQLSRYYAEPAGSKYIENEPYEWPDDDSSWVEHLGEPEDSPYWLAVFADGEIQRRRR